MCVLFDEEVVNERYLTVSLGDEDHDEYQHYHSPNDHKLYIHASISAYGDPSA